MTANKPTTNAGKNDEPVLIETKPGHHKDIGGGESENWNLRQMRLVVSALPGVKSDDKKNAGVIGSAVCYSACNFDPLSRGIGVQN